MSWKLELSLPMLTLGLPLSCLLVLLSYPLLPLPAPPVLASSPLLPPQKDGEDEGEGGEGSRGRGFTIDFIHSFMTPSCCTAGHDWGLFFLSLLYKLKGATWLVTTDVQPHLLSVLTWSPRVTFALLYLTGMEWSAWTVHHCWIQTKRMLSISEDDKLLSV